MGNYVRTPTVYQMEAAECGAASLSMILAYFGKHLPLEQLRIETGVSRDGCNAGNIMNAAKRLGLECHGYRKKTEYLKAVETPCIIFWNYVHFVVFEGFKGKYAYINDPASGRRKLSFAELNDSFTNVVLTFKATSKFKKEKSSRSAISFLTQRLMGYRKTMIKLFFIGVLTVFPGLVTPVLTQVFLDNVLVGGNAKLAFKLIVFMLSAVFLQIGLTLYRDKILVRLQKKMALTSSREFLSKMLRLPISFYDQRYVGDLTERATSNANISRFLAGDFAETVLNIFAVMSYLALLIIYSPVLTTLAAATVIINIIIVLITSKAISSGAVKLRQDMGELAGALCAGISITDTLKASGAEADYIRKILEHNAKTTAQEQKLSRLWEIGSAVPEAVRMLADIAILIIGSLFIIDGRMTVGSLTAFAVLFGSFTRPIEKIVRFIKNIQTTKADISRTDDIMSYHIDSKFDASVSKKDIRTKLNGEVELNSISFGYSRLSPPLIEELSFKLGCGSSIAFVGESGSGKSTVSKIISGLYEPWNGEVLFDGIPAKNIPNEVLSASVSTVSQEISLFSGTIRDNLTMWNSKISEQDMIAAAKDACIHDVISQKPGAYDFRLSEGGSNFSGGQRQRLEIARALAINPTLLIMDEATSALDPIVEKQIMDNIKRRGCTCIVIAHRLSAIRDCDQIMVMSDGKIVQRGTHEELINFKGQYRTFFQK